MLTPRPYQVVGRAFLQARRFALLADEMRVGKTPQAILAAVAIGAKRTTVICPAIAVQQWKREWKRWGGCGEFEVFSYNQAHKATAGTRDVLVVDEAHYCKNPATERAKAVFGKGGLAHSARHIWALTGTPAPNHAAELYVLMKCFGITKMGYGEFTRYYCNTDWRTGRVFGTKPSRIPELRSLLSQFMLRRTRKDVAPDMPPIMYDVALVQGQFPPDVEADANGALAELTALRLLMARTPEAKRAEVLAAHAADFVTARRFTALAKVAPAVERTSEMLKEGTVKQTVLFGFFVEPLKMFRDQMLAKGYKVGLITGETPDKERNRIIDQFRLGLLHVVAANILAAGTAIDLSAASYGQFLELDWVVGNNVQAANRFVSMDKAEPVSMDVLTWEGSSDEDVQSALARKASTLRQLFN